jgi:regulator of protease activity HflC (stomatin/prohibitin superfamily)
VEFAIVVLVMAALLAVVAFRSLPRVTVFEHQRGLRYEKGRLTEVAGPGRYVLRPGVTVQTVDLRERVLTVAGQEVLTSDGLGLRVSVAARFSVADPRLAVTAVASYDQSLYLLLQLALRDLVSGAPLEEVLSARTQLSGRLLEATAEDAERIGLRLLSADVKDLMLPPEIRRLLSLQIEARTEGLAALERARGETAALRNLANAARMLSDNPALGTLRLLQSLESSSGNTIVLGLRPDGTLAVPPPG